jgi:hypothetical protein
VRKGADFLAIILTVREPSACYLCGGELPEDANRDHVIPAQLYDPQNTPGNLYTLPACPKCNSGLSKDEEYFRACVLSQGYGQKEATNVWDGPVRRSLARSQGFKRMLASDIVPVAVSVPFYSESGQYIGDGSAIKWSVPRIKRVIEKIVRGLYWRHTETLLGATVFTIWHFDPHQTYPSGATLPELWQRAATFESGGNVLTYSYLIAEDDARHSIWWLRFYGTALFLVMTEPKDDAAV